MKKRIQSLPLSSIRIDGGTQPREEINSETVDNYAEKMEGGEAFPPIVVFFDGVEYWLADGFHRFHASRKAGMVAIECEVNTGTVREAILFAVGCNDKHGLPRTNKDKRRAVEILLNDPEWSQWSDVKVSELCSVSRWLVGDARKTTAESALVSEPKKVKFTTSTGKEATYTVKPRERKQSDGDNAASECSANDGAVNLDKPLVQVFWDAVGRMPDIAAEEALEASPTNRHSQHDTSTAMSIAQQAVNILRNIPLTDVNRKKAFVYVRNLCNEALEE